MAVLMSFEKRDRLSFSRGFSVPLDFGGCIFQAFLRLGEQAADRFFFRLPSFSIPQLTYFFYR
jgi:hypothetical protein